VFAATRVGRIGVMTACVLCHNERFLLDAMHPVLKPYRALRIFLPVHGTIGACALVLVGAIALGCSGNGWRTDHQFDASNASMRAPKRMIPRRRRWMTHSYAAALTLLRVCVILGVTRWAHDCTTWHTRSIVIISCGTLSR
jgi:hypothetical protein